MEAQTKLGRVFSQPLIRIYSRASYGRVMKNEDAGASLLSSRLRALDWLRKLFIIRDDKMGA